MILLDLIFALIFTVLAVAIVIVIFGGGYWYPGRTLGGLMFLFMVLFLAIWAGGIWLEPFGPRLWGGYWAPFIFIAIILILLLGATIPSQKLKARYESEAGVRKEEEPVASVFGIFFWILSIVLIITIILRYA